MATIENPRIINIDLGELPLRADEITAQKFIEDNELGTYSSFESNNDNKFSNDYGRAYNYYVSGLTYTEYWKNTGVTYDWYVEFGYHPTIKSIDYT